jgi:hypothetical protein
MSFKKTVKNILSKFGYKVEKIDDQEFADPKKLEKASKFIERFREIVSDPINILINRVEDAGYIDASGSVILHNGNKVPFSGAYSYYGNFSEILLINRGVHEPLEEYCFQETIARIESTAPTMIELGSYWAHYSMWMQKNHPNARCFMVEPEQAAIDCGKNNFDINKFKGEFIKAFVSRGEFELDVFLVKNKIDRVDLLHSDIQGYELEMIDGASKSFSEHKIDYVFISTHSEGLHSKVVSSLERFGYNIEVSSPFERHTTSCDGFVMASSSNVERVFHGFNPLGRIEILMATPSELLNSITTNTNVRVK